MHYLGLGWGLNLISNLFTVKQIKEGLDNMDLYSNYQQTPNTAFSGNAENPNGFVPSSGVDRSVPNYPAVAWIAVLVLIIVIRILSDKAS